MPITTADVMQRWVSVGTKKLLKRYCRAAGCDKERAAAVLAAYKKFLALKVVCTDMDDEALEAPPGPVHAMWREHVLDTAQYLETCETLCGRLIHHLPLDAADDEPRYVRRCHQTLQMYRKHFEQAASGELWDFGALRELTAAEAAELTREGPATKRARSSSSIGVSVQAPYMPLRAVQARTDQTVSQLFEAFVSESGSTHLRAGRSANPPTVRLRCSNNWLHDLQLLGDCGIKEGSVVYIAQPAQRHSRDQLAVTIKEAAGNASAVVYVRQSDTVDSLTKVAQDVLGVPRDCVQIIFRGEVLTLSNELGAHHIEDGSTVQMVVGRRRAAEATMSPGGTWR